MQYGTSAAAEKNLSNVIKIDEEQIQEHLGEMARSTVEETLTYYAFPDKHHRQIRTNPGAPGERIMREIRRRSRVVGCFPDGKNALMLAAARLRHIAGTKWGTRRYMNMDRRKELKQEQQAAKEKAA